MPLTIWEDIPIASPSPTAESSVCQIRIPHSGTRIVVMIIGEKRWLWKTVNSSAGFSCMYFQRVSEKSAITDFWTIALRREIFIFSSPCRAGSSMSHVFLQMHLLRRFWKNVGISIYALAQNVGQQCIFWEITAGAGAESSVPYASHALSLKGLFTMLEIRYLRCHGVLSPQKSAEYGNFSTVTKALKLHRSLRFLWYNS